MQHSSGTCEASSPLPRGVIHFLTTGRRDIWLPVAKALSVSQVPVIHFKSMLISQPCSPRPFFPPPALILRTLLSLISSPHCSLALPLCSAPAPLTVLFFCSPSLPFSPLSETALATFSLLAIFSPDLSLSLLDSFRRSGCSLFHMCNKKPSP